jgi:phage shock protein E
MKMSTELILLLVVVVVIVLVVARRGGSALAPEQAREYLQADAMVVDVRTPGEFASAHLPQAVNIPLQSLESGIRQQVPDKSKVILLHCQSGSRSGAAQRRLRQLGYTNAFNIGSYHQAQRITSP